MDNVCKRKRLHLSHAVRHLLETVGPSLTPERAMVPEEEGPGNSVEGLTSVQMPQDSWD